MLKKISGLFYFLFPNFVMAFSFLLPISEHYAIIALNAIGISWLLSNKIKRPDFREINSLLLIGLVFFWILHAISLLYSSNLSRGLSDIVQKISFILLPIIFITSKDILLVHSRKILMAFIYGLIIFGLVSLVNATYHSISYTFKGIVFSTIPIDTPWENYFMHERFSMGKHPTYISMFYILGIAIAFGILKREHYDRFMKLWYVFLIIFFIVMTILLASRAGIISGFFVVIGGIIWLFLKKMSFWLNLSFILFTLVLISLFAVNNSRFQFLLKGLGFEDLNSIVDDSNQEQRIIGENMIRVQIWKSIPDVMEDHWFFGYGIGDSKLALVRGYKSKGITYAYENQFNAHNQILETLISLGVVGFINIMFILTASLIYSIKKRYFLLLFFFVIIIGVGLFESIFERISGVMFFSFFYCLFLILNPIQNKT